MNLFLKDLGITFRRDESGLPPRISKIGPAKNREQKGAVILLHSTARNSLH
jgi:translation initiation factor RLI1